MRRVNLEANADFIGNRPLKTARGAIDSAPQPAAADD